MQDSHDMATRLQHLAADINTRDSLQGVVLRRLESGVETKAGASQDQRRIFVLRHRFAGMSVAAAVVGALVGATWLLSSHDRLAFAEVQAALENITTAIFAYHYPNAPSNDIRSFVSADQSTMRLESPNGYIAIISKERSLRLNTKEKLAQKGPGQSLATGDEKLQDFLQILARAHEEAVRQLGQRSFDGQDLMGFVVPVDAFGKTNNYVKEKMQMEVWVDPETKLPVRIETRPVAAGEVRADMQHAIIAVEFNVPLDEGLFSMEPPPNYRLLEESEPFPFPGSERPKNRDAEKWVLLPGQGIGSARFGMSVEQVVEALGKPDSTFEGTDEDVAFLNYSRFGCQIMICKKEGMSIISCWREGEMNFGPFIGRTREGISISSSPDDVRRAYGEPSAVNESAEENRLHLREEQELPHPAYEVRLVLIWRQVLVLKELGIAAKHFVQIAIALRHISVSCLSGSA